VGCSVARNRAFFLPSSPLFQRMLALLLLLHSLLVLLCDALAVVEGWRPVAGGYHLWLLAASFAPYLALWAYSEARGGPLTLLDAAACGLLVTLVDDVLWGPMLYLLGVKTLPELLDWVRLQFFSLDDWEAWWWADLYLVKVPVSPALMGWSIVARALLLTLYAAWRLPRARRVYPVGVVFSA